jgi:hypothetical protein
MPFGYEPSEDTTQAYWQARTEWLCRIYTSRFFKPTASLAGVPAKDLPDDFCRQCRRYLSTCTRESNPSCDDLWEEA